MDNQYEVRTFQECEDDGRELFAGILEQFGKVERYEFTDDKSCPVDCLLTALTKTTFATEIKNRDIPRGKYGDGFLEKLKYHGNGQEWRWKDGMLGFRAQGYHLLFTTFFNDGWLGVWNLEKIKDIESRWIWKLCTDTTADNTYGKKKVWKEVALLQPKEAKWFKYNPEKDKWVRDDSKRNN